MLLQHFLEGHRWQFALAVYLLPSMYGIHRFQKHGINLLTKGVLSVWFGAAVLLPWIIPIFTLPAPGGPYTVGTEMFYWVDSTRAEWFTDEDQNDVRELIVQIWYPSEINIDEKPEPYLDFIDIRAKTLASAGAIPEFFPSHLKYINTNSYKGLEIVKLEKSFPVFLMVLQVPGISIKLCMNTWSAAVILLWPQIIVLMLISPYSQMDMWQIIDLI